MNIEDLLILAEACNEFSGDLGSLAPVLGPYTLPFRCVHIEIFCLLTRQRVSHWVDDDARWLASIDWHNLYRVESESMSQRVDARLCEADTEMFLITSQQRNESSMREDRFSFVVASSVYALAEALQLVRLIAPQLRIALSRAVGAQTSTPSQLSAAERCVAYWLLRGKTNKEIARELHKSEATVKNQLHTLFRKLQVNRRSQAVEYLRQLSLLPSPAGPGSEGERRHSRALECQQS